jgi:hypothetical protein
MTPSEFQLRAENDRLRTLLKACDERHAKMEAELRQAKERVRELETGLDEERLKSFRWGGP